MLAAARKRSGTTGGGGQETRHEPRRSDLRPGSSLAPPGYRRPAGKQRNAKDPMTLPIQTHGLARRYGRHQALDGLDLDVPEGSIYGLVGPNGAGKTTAIKILMNL